MIWNWFGLENFCQAAVGKIESSSHLVVSLNRGTLYKRQNTKILIVWTPKKAPQFGEALKPNHIPIYPFLIPIFPVKVSTTPFFSTRLGLILVP